MKLLNKLGIFDVHQAEPITNIQQAREIKLAELKVARDKAELQPINNFDVDEKSIMRINNAITVINATKQPIEWTLADNTICMVNADDLQNVILALAQQSNDVHEKYRVLKEQVNACESIADVRAIEW